MIRPLLAVCLGLFVTAASGREADVFAPPVVFHVTLAKQFTAPSAGRLLVFATDAAKARAASKSGAIKEVDLDAFQPSDTAVAGAEVSRLAPGQDVDMLAGQEAYPGAFASLPPGDYAVQAVLDVNHDYNYHGRSGGDLLSQVVTMHLPGPAPKLTLVDTVPGRKAWDFPPKAMSGPSLKHLAEARQATRPIDQVSPVLSAFWGRPIHLRGWVVLPPGYEADKGARYPVVYSTHGFGGDTINLTASAAMAYGAMAEKQMPPMIWVLLDESSPTGTHEFADSVNNGPWGRALTEELIPGLEKTYRMDGRPDGRFLTGHSSGGWATLWLQTRYPKIFGGTWSTSPDPSDFHDFTGVDLYAAHANVYRRPDGSPYPLVRDHGKVVATFEQFARIERALGDYGGQLASFDWVFSPRGADGRPQPMFDRDTGAVDPSVVAYWRDHYDIAQRLKAQWPALKADLDGKIHLYVGTADTFYLDGAAHRLQAVLDGLHARSEFRFLPGRTHFDLFKQGEDRSGLLKQIAWAMYAQARPRSTLRQVAAH